MWRTAVPCRLAAVLQGLVVRTGGGCRRRDLAPQAQGGTAQPCATSVLVSWRRPCPSLPSDRTTVAQHQSAVATRASNSSSPKTTKQPPVNSNAPSSLLQNKPKPSSGSAAPTADAPNTQPDSPSWERSPWREKVRSCFERAVEAEPSNLAALESLLSFYLDAPSIVGGGVDKADPIAEGISRIRPASGLQAKAAIHRKREEFEQAEALLRKAIELEPDEVGHLLSLASFLSRRERYDESDGLFAKAFQRQPDSPRVWYSRASELVRSGRNAAEARSLLERYLATGLYAPDAEPHSDARKLLGRL